MQWNEMSTVKKILFVIGLISGAAYFILTGLDILTLLDIFNVWAVPKAISPALLGTFWICGGFLQKNKKLAIAYYILGAAWFLFSFFHIFGMIVS